MTAVSDRARPSGPRTASRRRPRAPTPSGWLVVDKPKGLTSNQVVTRVRRLLRGAKVGHAGTLDALATGVLPLAVGEATKAAALVMGREKTYRFTVAWGTATATDDAEGETIAVSPVRPVAATIRAALASFTGAIAQVPPRYSAVKLAGRRASDLARAGSAPTLAARPVLIHELRLEEVPDADHAVFLARTGKGAYIRALARDLAESLGTVGHVAALRRLAVGPFTENQAIPLENLEALGHSAAAFEHLCPVETPLDDIPAVAVTEAEARLLKQGQPVSLWRTADLKRIGGLGTGTLVRARCGPTLVALAQFEKGQLRPVRVFNL